MERKVNTYKIMLNAVYEISLALNSPCTVTEAMSRVMNTIGTYMEVENGFILLKDESTGELKLSGSTGVSPESAKNLVYKTGEGIVGKVHKYGLPMMIMDIGHDPDFMDKLNRKTTTDLDFMAVPITANGLSYGVLAIDKKTDALYNNESYLDFLKMTATLLGSFLHKMTLIDREKANLKEEKDRLLYEVTEKFSYKGMVGISKVMREVFKRIEQIKDSPTTVLIRGESGTGKELVARAVHYSGNRAKKPFITVNCAAIPSELIESELFGHKKGSFTGANADKKGKFEAANGGTIFLDEIGDMPYEAQSKLLRVLQERVVEKIGDTKPIEVDVRVIAATNRNLEDDIKNNRFRMDLYYRLNVMNIFLPPLRERKEDIPQLAFNAVKKLSKMYGWEFKIEQQAVEALTHCNWPGNIRELENCLERSALTADDHYIKVSDLSCMKGEACLAGGCGTGNIGANKPAYLPEEPYMGAPTGAAPAFAPQPQYGAPVSSQPAQTSAPVETPAQPEQSYEQPAEHVQTARKITEIPPTVEEEKQMIVDALERTGWVQAKAARLLGMTVRQINYRIKKFNIEIPRI